MKHKPTGRDTPCYLKQVVFAGFFKRPKSAPFRGRINLQYKQNNFIINKDTVFITVNHNIARVVCKENICTTLLKLFYCYLDIELEEIPLIQVVNIFHSGCIYGTQKVMLQKILPDLHAKFTLSYCRPHQEHGSSGTTIHNPSRFLSSIQTTNLSCMYMLVGIHDPEADGDIHIKFTPGEKARKIFTNITIISNIWSSRSHEIIDYFNANRTTWKIKPS